MYHPAEMSVKPTKTTDASAAKPALSQKAGQQRRVSTELPSRQEPLNLSGGKKKHTVHGLLRRWSDGREAEKGNRKKEPIMEGVSQKSQSLKSSSKSTNSPAHRHTGKRGEEGSGRVSVLSSRF
jgi:hypothetical protein